MTLLGRGGPAFTPNDTRLVTAPGHGLAEGNRLAVPAQRLAADGPGLLTVRDPAAGRSSTARAVPVRLVPVAGLPADVVVVPEELAGEHRLADGGWRLEPAAAAVPAAVELESPAALSLDEAALAVQRSPLLAGHVLTHGEDTAQDTWIDLDGLPFRVRSATDQAGQRLRGLLAIGAETRFSVFAPGGRSGVDIVVLADCSGSMGVDDIPDRRESPRRITARRNAPAATVTRLDALKGALRAMIDARARVDGLVTRFALVRFDLTTRTLFPGTDGMAEVTGGSGDHTLDQLRGAVTLLQHDHQATDIGRALHKAAELLHRHGVPGNERLIVLVSDGAHWAPMSEERSGESVAATDDPVSLMEDLHGGLGIRLHAVGISDRSMFGSWWNELCRRDPTLREPPENLVPNHDLLGRLVDVAGGDRHRIGGVDVLEEYFAELGSGVVRAVGRPTPGRLPALQLDPAALAAAPAGPAADPERQRRWEQQVEEVVRRYAEVCTASSTRLGYPLFRTSLSDVARLRQAAASHTQFTAWLSVADKVFHERLHESVRFPRRNRRDLAGLDLPELTGPLWDGRLGEVHGLRNFFLHDAESEKRSPEQNRAVGEVILRHTGKYAVEEHDAAGWHSLQQGLLDNLAGVLAEVYEILVAAPPPPPAPRESEGGSGPSEPSAAHSAGAPAPAAAPPVPMVVRVVAQGFD
ncbi:VWA domain-containing protein [Kitasatospora sp. NPDC052868]|uniref:VWA domain-containing protein n=1 Tax=Kitasatospora sp. NPDC052868 TaxID=3364060 RepID=UPI0037C89A88